MSQQQNKKYKEQQMKILALKNTITKIKKNQKMGSMEEMGKNGELEYRLEITNI